MQSKLTGLCTVATPGGGEPATLATGRYPGSRNVTVDITSVRCKLALKINSQPILGTAMVFDFVLS